MFKRRISFALILCILICLCSCSIEKEPEIIKPTAIFLMEEAVELKPEESHQLQYTVVPEGADTSDITWQSVNEDIVALDAAGNIKAVAPGTTKVICSNADGVNAVCEVTVIQPTAYEQLNEYEKIFYNWLTGYLLQTTQWNINRETWSEIVYINNPTAIRIGDIFEPDYDQNYDEGFHLEFLLYPNQEFGIDEIYVGMFINQPDKNRMVSTLNKYSFDYMEKLLEDYPQKSEMVSSAKINAALEEYWNK